MSKKIIILNLIVENIALSLAVIFGVVAAWMFAAPFYIPNGMQQITNFAWKYAYISILLLAIWLLFIPLTHDFKATANAQIKTMIHAYKKKYFPQLLNKKINHQEVLKTTRKISYQYSLMPPQKKRVNPVSAKPNRYRSFGFTAPQLRNFFQGINGNPQEAEAYILRLKAAIITKNTNDQFGDELLWIERFVDACMHLARRKAEKSRDSGYKTFSYLGTEHLDVAGTPLSRTTLDRMVSGHHRQTERALKFGEMTPAQINETKE